MGNMQSNALSETMTATNTAVTNVVSNTGSSLGATSIAANNFTFTVGPPVVLVEASQYGPAIVVTPSCRYCNIESSQSLNSSQKTSLNAAITDQKTLTNELTTSLQQKASQLSDSAQGSLATTLSCQNNSASINQAISSRVENNITTNVMTTLRTFLSNANNGTITILGNADHSVFKNAQTLISSQVSDLLVKAITGVDIKNVSNVSGVQSASQTNKSVQTGLLQDLAGLLQGPFIIIGIIVIVLAILAYVFRGSISKIAEKKAGVSFGRRLVRFGKRVR